MKRAHFRFYAELNDFLPRARRFASIAHDFELQPSVKDSIEALGVPHTEVDLIVVNGKSEGFDYRLRDRDRVSVYPVFESFDLSHAQRLRRRPLRTTRFVLDVHLGRLARYLRLLGFDSLYRRDHTDDVLARLSAEQTRVLLTRDVGLLKRSAITHGYYVRATDPRAQVVEVVRRFDLAEALAPGTRCARCNGPLESVAKADVVAQLRAGTRRAYEDFWRCGECGHVYWRGAHDEGIRRTVAYFRRRLLEAGSP